MQGGLNAAVKKDDPDLKTLGGRLKFARENRQLTQVQLSRASGVNQSDISKLERNDVNASTSLPALARALQCDVDWLDTGDGDPDFGRALRGWPFPAIDRTRFIALDQEQRTEIQGAVRKMISDFEADATQAGAHQQKVVVTKKDREMEKNATPPVRNDSTKVRKSS